MLRPVIRANRHRARATHVFVFFILLVANIGGALTPLGDPPLFLGFLLGVPFFWPAIHLALPTLFLAAILLALFYGLDRLMHRRAGGREPAPLAEIERLGLDGKVNLLLLAATVAIILLRALWHPEAQLSVLGVAWTLDDAVADILLAGVAGLSLVLTPQAIRKANDFAWGAMVEVAILFAAIFVTLQPVMAMIAAGEEGPLAALAARLHNGAPDPTLFYWATGALSAFLDNAPTYVVFFGFAGGDAATLSGPLSPVLTAISCGAVYFGAMSYIGNAPNFMAKAMIESQGLKMPSFFGYLGWSCLCLLPWLAVLDLLFFRL
jgi:Na+/H+ antiporter NhaD/arsenite permease-like protein